MLGHNFDFSVKIVVVGDSGIGKTSFLIQLVRGQWLGETQPTLGVEFLNKVVQTEKHKIQIQLWDTAGQELFRSVTRNYYRGATGCFVLFDITNRDSFSNVQSWLDDVLDLANTNAITILIGNKSDLSEKRQVTTAEAEQFANERSMFYFETSAKTGDNVKQALDKCVDLVEQLAEDGHLNYIPRGESNTMQPTLREEKESSCCK
ncbi:small GTP-binding protein [Histomonas meleagridis]|uniref:small GTP-binding protein n=1 Tax=Histomonas meleagridis TaxID=135588 RepID=UPI00355954BA|nr:small GTP-binding protein [Histomonas meleagridis]KAH0804027.1 small GTP-binding protein [Histomonas meleagridis]